MHLTPVTGVTVETLRGMLAGIPALVHLRDTGMLIIEDLLIEDNIRAAEVAVGTELDVMLGVHEIRCQHDLSDEDIPDGVIIKPALTKPRNWFEQDRWGKVTLPVLPVKEILSVTLYPSGWSNVRFPLRLDLVRVTKDGFSVASVPMAIGGVIGGLLHQGVTGNPLTLLSATDGRAMPGGLEVHYRGGLSQREIDQYPLIRTLVQLQALILLLTFYQSFLGGGAQKEAAGVDGMTNSVELARRDVLGPLGGEIKALTASYNRLLQTAKMKFGANIATTWMG